MPKFCANLAFLFTERPMRERFAAAAAAGFTAVEFPTPYDDVDGYAELLREYRLRLVLFNLPMGNFAAGERGFAIDPERRDEFHAGVEQGVSAARRLGCMRINALAGIRKPELDEATAWATAVENLRYAAARLREIGATLMVEPLNALDTPDFFTSTTTSALRLLDDVGAENARLQFDCYHAQRGEGNIVDTFTRNMARIGHVQIADSPAAGNRRARVRSHPARHRRDRLRRLDRPGISPARHERGQPWMDRALRLHFVCACVGAWLYPWRSLETRRDALVCSYHSRRESA